MLERNLQEMNQNTDTWLKNTINTFLNCNFIPFGCYFQQHQSCQLPHLSVVQFLWGVAWSL